MNTKLSLFKCCSSLTLSRPRLNSEYWNNSKLHLLTGRFKHCLSVFSWSSILKWKKWTKETIRQIDIIYISGKFGTLWTEATLWKNTMKKIFHCIFALERTWPLTRADWSLTLRQQVLTALRFYTRRTFEQVIGNLLGVSVFAACTVIHRVSRAIVKRKGHFLSFPENLADSKRW